MSHHHHFNYIELPATDITAMQEFYGVVFGWTFQKWADTYVSINGAGVDGGFDANPGARKPSRHGPLVVLYSDDIEKTQSAVEAAGGIITLPLFDFPGGKRFHFTDPSENELAVWTTRQSC